MATVYKTPGVYVEEIPKLPPSVAQVETAIPAFIGYTAKAEKLGENLRMKPTRISSLLEFVQYYGSDTTPDTINVVVDTANNYAVTQITVANTERYFMFDSLRTFFDNGGGDCFIVSVDLFGTAPAIGNDTTGLQGGLKALEKVTEPTIILFPDASNMAPNADDPNFYTLQQLTLQQCANLQDRIGLFDLKENQSAPLANADANQQSAVTNFRNNIGINNLKYGAAYTPWIYTTYPRDVSFNTFSGNVTAASGGAVVDLMAVTADPALNELVSQASKAFADIALITAKLNAIADAGDDGVVPGAATDPMAANTPKDRYRQLADRLRSAPDAGERTSRLNSLIAFVTNSLLAVQTINDAAPAGVTGTSLLNDINAYAVSDSLWRGAVKDLIGIQKNAATIGITAVDAAAVDALYGTVDTTWLGAAATTFGANTTDYTNAGTITGASLANVIEAAINAAFNKVTAFFDTVSSAAQTYQKAAQDNLYEKHTIIGNIVRYIKKELSKIPPSGAVAGVYARVDNARGVWKAPANESLNSVLGPSVNISHDQQANLNVDAVAGKSVNAIRAFTGRGTLVWGLVHWLATTMNGDTSAFAGSSIWWRKAPEMLLNLLCLSQMTPIRG
ncbi:hypothetical protein [Spirosoma sp. KNUC1025]|uniref:hypothetical protein n=1 Tax=Spirosoma sp. KNUC1025 TaxID=2894082 RepID=UPI00386DB029|nr:phage tail sheath subtilisin-like domain-containing protein [Spirosoma sp. KNUC1025]